MRIPEGLNYLVPLLSEQSRPNVFAEQEKIEITPFTALELKPFYGANRYYLFVKTIYKDVPHGRRSSFFHRKVRS